MASFSLKDLETLEKFATKLCIPLLAVASVLQPPGEHRLPLWLISTGEWIVLRGDHSLTISTLVMAVLWTAVWAAVCTFFFFLIWLARLAVNGHSWAEWLEPILLPFVGSAFLTMGALGLCKIPALHAFGVQDPLPSLNIFWEVGSLTSGLWCMQIAQQTTP